MPVDSTTAALDAVRDGAADYACVPIENSIDGSILPTLDSLAIGTPLQMFAELTLDVAFSIAVRPGRTAADVRTVAAFPVAAAQVRHWLAERLPAAELRPANSNAAAAQQVAEGRVDAAVSSPLAAATTGSPTLAEGVVDEPNARPASCWSARPARRRPAPGPTARRWCCGSTTRRARWSSALTEFGVRDIDLTRIESRPTRTELGTYVFFLDCVGHLDDDAVAEALKALHQRCTDVRYLGSWPTGDVAGAPPPRWTRPPAGSDALRKGSAP